MYKSLAAGRPAVHPLGDTDRMQFGNYNGKM